MFNGIVETIGTIQQMNVNNGCHHFVISHPPSFDDLKIDDSISVNGVCLTITDCTSTQFQVTAVPETLRLTNLQFLKSGHKVNLERSLLFNQRISGHITQGHVDGMGEILDIKNEGDALIVMISLPPPLKNYVVDKGFITLDGMSITVIKAEENHFSVTFIPHTQKITIVSLYTKGHFINIEVDMIGKYIEKFLRRYQIC